MSIRPADAITEGCRRFSRSCFLAVAGVALIAGIGWWADLEALHSVVHGWASMKPITVVCLVLLGLGGYVIAGRRPDRPAWLAPACGGLAFLGGLQTLAAYAFGVDLGIDSALMPARALSAASAGPFPGRMAHATAVEVLLVAAGILLAQGASRWRKLAAQGLAILGLVVAATAVIGYLYGVGSLYSVTVYSSMALNTAVLGVLLNLALLTAQPGVGFMEVVTSDHLGGVMARRMLPLSVALPIAIGWARLMGQRAGYYTTEFGLALFAMSSVLIFVFLTISTARTLNRVDIAQEEANERFHLAVEGAPSAMIMVDADGMIRLCNGGAARVFGYDRDELLGRSVEVLLPEPLRAGHVAHRAAYWTHPEARSLSRPDLLGLRKDGRTIPVEVVLNPIESAGGAYVLAGVVDVSQRKQAEAARAHLAAIVQSSEDVIISKSLEGTIVSWNFGAEVLFQYSPDEIIGKPIGLLVPDHLLEEEARILARLRAGEHVAHYETVRRRKDGTPVDVSLTISPIFDDRGDIVGASTICHDITARKRAADLLAESEARFRQLAENIQEVFWITSVDKSQLLYVSAAYESIWGRTLESLHAEPASWLQAIHEDDRPRVMRAARERQAKGTYDEEYRIVRPDGSIRWIRDRAYPIRDGNGDVVRIVGVAIDMTQNHKLEDQLRESQKMEAVGQLAGGIAHDFNNLLSVINGNAQLALGELSRNHPAAPCLREIERAGSRATDLVRRILTFSRQEMQDRRVVKMQPVVEEAVKFLRAILPSMIEIRTSIEPDLPSVLIDPVQIHQVIMNLGTNAAHAMNERGVLEIRLARIVVDEDLTRGYPELRPGEHVSLTVSDDGSGMDAATQQRIFEPFFTTKPQGTGTGLGLAVVHGIVRSHEATIAVYSTPGVGTTFRIYFPAVQTDAGEAEADTTAPVRGDGQHVMYVDDEAALVSLVTRMLESLGYEVSGFTSPEAALQEFAARPDDYDLLVTDLSMPGMSGIEVAQRLLRIRPDLPVIVTSGYVRPSDESRALAIGVKAMLLKPNTIRELGTMVHQVFSALR